MPSEAPMVDPQARQSYEEAPEALQGTYKAGAGNVQDSVVVQGHENTVTYNGITLEARVPGAVIVTPAQEIVLSKRQGPIEVRQQQLELLDRDHERTACLSPGRAIIEIFGSHGIGKSTVLAALAYDLPNNQPTSYKDGVVCCGMQEFSFDEILFKLWSYFYQASVSWTVRPPSEQQRLHLRDISALLLLDDVSLNENELRSLDVAVSKSTVIFSTEQRRMFFARSIPIFGLPLEYMGPLAEIELRKLAFQGPEVPEELLADYWKKHQGNPNLIVREISDWALATSQRILPNLKSETASAVLEAIQVLEGPVPEDVLKASVNSSSAGEVAEDLVKSGQLKANSPRYTYPWPHREISEKLADEYRSRALMYIGQKPTLQVPSDLPLALQLLKWSAGHFELRTAAAATARKLSDAFMTSGYFDRWSESLRAALRVAETIGDTDTGAWARHNLGAAAFCRGDLAEARANLREALQIRRDNKADADAIEATETLLREVEAQTGESGSSSGSGSSTPPPSAPAPGSGGQGSAAEKEYAQYVQVEPAAREAEKEPVKEQQFVHTYA
jgi:tetratricopeptide (TPR) repeat protein